MSKKYLLFLIIICLAIMTSCKKDNIPIKEESAVYVQYFEGLINGEKIRVESSYEENRDKLFGQLTGLSRGTEKQYAMYTLNVTFPQGGKNDIGGKMRLNFFDLDKRKQEIKGDFSYHDTFDTFIVYYRSSDKAKDGKEFFVPKENQPFIAEITRYEYPKNSIIPYVGGKLNGVLYSELNPKDSVVVSDATFDVRF